MRDAALDLHRSPARGGARSRAAEAPPLDDMINDGPVSRAAPRRGDITSAAVAAQRLGGGRLSGGVRGRNAPGIVGRLRGRLPRVRPLKAVMVTAFGVALVGIVTNAMVFQRGHHPAPLFGLGRSVDGAGDDAQRTAASAPPPAAPVAIEKTGTIAAPTPAAVAPPPTVAAAQPKPAPLHRAAAKAKPSDAKAESHPAHPRPGHAAPVEAKVAPKAEGKPDPLAKLLAGPAHPAKPDVKPAPAAKGDAKAKPVAAAPHAVHHAAAADAAKPAAKAE